jgi:hypothetical protein
VIEREQGSVNYGDDGGSQSYSIQIDPFCKFTILTTRNSLFRFSPATPLSINRGELKYEGREEGPN